MPSITIKGIPPALHAELKQLARREGRSLNQEVLLRLRCAVSASPRHADVAARIERLERMDRALLAGGYRPSSPEEIVRRIRDDRAGH